MNYPSVWIVVAQLVGFRNEHHFILFVSACILGYLYACFALLRKSPSVYMLLAMLSGSALLAIERGNSDLLVFALIIAALHIQRNWLRSSLVLLAVVLKVYPAVTIYGFFRRNIKVMVITALLAIAYLAAIREEIILIQTGNSASGYLSYGMRPGATVTGCLLLALAASIWLLKKKGVASKLFTSESSKHEREFFVIGSSVFVSTFMLAKNWDYRLIFLLLCLPYILSLKNKLILHATAVCVLLSMNVLAMNAIGIFTMRLSEISKYYLFVTFSLALGYELLRHDES